MVLDSLLGSLLDDASALLPGVVELRRDLHRHPELGLHLPRTQARILTELDGLSLALSTGTSTTSVVGVLDGARPGPTVLLRGDMDALPMPEDTGLPFTSEVEGAMHACGHDTHVAMLTGAARQLAARREELAGRVVFMFQPGEEGFHGARHMLEEGLLDDAGGAGGAGGPDGAGGAPVSGAFALHITSAYPTGTINLRRGPLLASSDTLRVVVRGRGGHASQPHRAVDPIPVACEIVQALQVMVTRRIDVFDPAVVTVARITAGTTNNVIPESAELLGTVRTVSETTRAKVLEGVRRVAGSIAHAHECAVEVELEAGYPVTVNDDGFADFTARVATELLGEDRVHVMPAPIMGAEDFSYVLQRVPGTMAFLGACPPGVDHETAPPNHSNRVIFDEQAMATGVAMYVAVALRHLAAG
jgi:hippurate hydrolase